MCQNIANGGRRCPIHLGRSIASVKLASDLSGLNRRQTESLFKELRREGRTTEAPTADQLSTVANTVRGQATLTDIQEQIETELDKGIERNETIDGATYYAMTRLLFRAKGRARQLTNRFAEIAERTGYTATEIRAKFDQEFASVDISRGTGNPPEYNATVRARAVAANLPYDRASVTALERLYALPSQEREQRPRVTRRPAPESSQIETWGYDEGRLELTFRNNSDQVFAYHDVPDGLWERMQVSPRPGSIWTRSIRGNEDYMYDTAEAADADSFAVRCVSCGQFRAQVHRCPQRVERENLEASGATAAQISEVMENSSEVVEDTVERGIEVDPETTNIVTEDFEIQVRDFQAMVDAAIADANQAPLGEMENDEEEPESPEEKATEGPRIAPTDNIVVPASHIAATDVYATREKAVEETGYPKQVTSDAPVLEIPEVTPDTQYSPIKLDTSSLIVKEIELEGYYGGIVAGGEGQASEYRYSHLPEDVKELIYNAPAHMNFIFKRTGYASTSELVASYDSRNLRALESTKYVEGRYIKTYKLQALSNMSAPVHEDPDVRRENVRAETEKLNALVHSGEAVSIAQVTSATRRYTFDANLEQQPLIKGPRTADLRAALKDNKVAYFKFELNWGREGAPSNHVDDQGYSIPQATGFDVEGTVAVRRNADGVIEVISSHRSLRCYCSRYRSTYYCEHLNYSQRHIGNMVQQMIPNNMAAGRTIVSADSTGRAASTHRLLTSPIRNRGDVELIENEGEEAYIRVSNGNTRSFYGSRLVSNLVPPEEIHNIGENPTPEELDKIGEYYDLSRSFHDLIVPSSMGTLRTALRRSDVEIPINVHVSRTWDRNIPRGRVTGTVRFAQNSSEDLRDVTLRSRDLQCDCEQYQEHYSCRHTRFVEAQAYAILQAGSSRAERPSESIGDLYSRHRAAIQAETQIQQMMRRENLTREQATSSIEELERLREERRIAREAEERARYIQAEAARAERSRVEAEERARSNAEVLAANTKYRERMLKRWENTEGSYTANRSEFYNDYKEALKRKRNGEEAVPFRTENVTDGICADEEGARQFGIELEFDIKPGVNRSQALRNIAQELHAEGLTGSDQQLPYHSAGQNNYATWSFEHDCTVDAELVSPLMKDTPEHWNQMRKALDIVKKHGGVATARTGSHVHVSTASYESSTAKHVELLRTVNENDDILYRMASSPSRGTHRGMQWCAPNVNDSHEEVSAEVVAAHDILGWGHSSHNVGLNFEGTNKSNYKASNIEFRMWDGTLDAAVIQQQVAVSAAVTDYAERNVMQKGLSKPTRDSRINVGSGKIAETAALAKAGVNSHTEETFTETTNKAAEFFDKIFRRKEDRAAAASLFAVTNWQARH